MAAETVVGYKISLLGEEDAIKASQGLKTELMETGKVLNELAKSKGIKTLEDKFKQLTKQLKELNKATQGTGTSGGSSGSGSSGKGNKDLKDQELTLSNIRKLLQQNETQGTATYTSLIEKAALLKQRQQDVNEEIRRQQQAFDASDDSIGYYKQLNAQLVLLRKTYRELTKAELKSGEGKQILKNIQGVDAELKKLDADMGIYARNVGNYKSAWEGLSSIATRFAGVIGIGIGIDEIIDQNKQISDSIADVAKTSGASIPQINELYESLKGRDTRTSLSDQLGIAEIGGRLGIAQDQLFEFVEAIDTVNVALGDQFGDAEGVTSTLAGIRNVLTDFQTEDTAADILHIGNALNFLESQGNSTAPVIADFVNRIGGVGQIVGLTAPQIFGLSTTLNELEVAAERGSSSVTKLLVDIAAAPATYARIAGLGIEEFTNLVNDDLLGALVLVSEQAKEGSERNSEFAKTLKNLGIEGTRELEVFAKLSTGQQLLNLRTQQAEEQLRSTASIQDEFNKKNATTAAQVDKLKNAFVALVVDTDTQGFISNLIIGVTSLVSGLRATIEVAKDNKIEFITLAVAVLALNGALIKQEIANIAVAASEKVKAYALRLTAGAQWSLNAAVAANPIGVVIAGVAAFVGLLVLAYNKIDIFRQAVDKTWQGMKELYNNSVSVRLALFQLVEPLKFLYALFFGGPGAIQKYLISLKTFATEAKEYFYRLGLEAFKLGKEISLALSIRESEKKRLKEDIQGIENEIKASTQRVRIAKVQSQIEQNKIDIAQREKAAQEEKKEQEKKEEERKKSAQKIFDIEKELRNASLEDLKEYAKSTDTILAEGARKEISRRKDAADAYEKALKDQLEAEKKIQDLRNQLIGNSFDRQSAEATTTKDRELQSFSASGATPEQIEEYTSLLLQAYGKQIAEIEKQREQSKNEAVAQITKMQEEIRAAQAGNNFQDAENDVTNLNSLFEIDIAKLENKFLEAELALETSLAKKQITEQQYAEQKSQLEISQDEEIFALEQSKYLRLEALQVEANERQLEAMRVNFENEKEELERQKEERQLQIEEDFENKLITDEERRLLLEETELLNRELEREAEIEFFEGQKNIIDQYAIDIISKKKKAAEQEIEITKKKTAEQLRLEKLQLDQERLLSDVRLNSVGAFVTGVKGLLGQDEKNRKKYAGILKVLALGEIAINLQKELSAIAAAAAANPLNAVTAGAAGAAQATAYSVLAYIRAAFAAATVIATKFNEGGAIGDASGLPASGEGIAAGPSHENRGIKFFSSGAVNEMEGGEGMIKNGQETYIINKKSTAYFKPEVLKMIGSGSSYSPRKRAMASKMNSFRGWGKQFASGGVASGALSIDTLEPPTGVAGDILSVQNPNQVFQDVAGRIEEFNTAINSRIDRIEVVIDPGKAVNAGNKQIEVEATRKL